MLATRELTRIAGGALLMIFLTALSAQGREDDTLARRRAYLDQIRRILPVSQPWEAWLAASGELPPDFEAMPSRPDPPDPLVRDVDGKNVRISTRRAWETRRAELKALFHRWILGSVPPPPADLRATVTSERVERGARVRDVELAFGPRGSAKLRMELFVPPGSGPFPVFLTQHTHRAWALIALRRGYVACVYAGSDSRDDTESFRAAYPEHDWSRLTRRAWAASRCVDYLHTLPEVDRERIALTGHSRNGKLSLIASALDERISAVISSSSGAGGPLSARDFSDPQFGEGIEIITRAFPEWFHPRFRFFAGREDRLPVDLHELVALCAPRPCLLSIALNDSVESTWAMQQTYLAVKPVYRLLKAPDQLRILWRPGGHETGPSTIERYLDWCDDQFGSRRLSGQSFPERFVHPWDWNAWKERQPPQPAPVAPAAARTAGGSAAERARVRLAAAEMLGEAPPRAEGLAGSYGREVPHAASLLGRSSPGEGIEKDQLVFGEYVSADVYMPAGLRASGRKAPALLWLHPFSFSNGYVAGYKRGQDGFRALARQGYVVFCFDQIGHGGRIEEAERFYDRHPRWSLLGKMVRDAEDALTAAAALPYVDSAQVWGLGFGMGSMVGLHLGALDDRLAGFVSVCGPAPWNSAGAGPDRKRYWARRHMLLPRLGLFETTPAPYDVPDLLAALAPRPLIVVAPTLDRDAPGAEMSGVLKSLRAVYARRNAGRQLVELTPEDFSHFDTRMQGRVADVLRRWHPFGAGDTARDGDLQPDLREPSLPPAVAPAPSQVAPPRRRIYPEGGALAGERTRVIVSSDIGGADPDDFQSMVHLLLYADVLDIEGLISSPPGRGRASHILEVLAAYEKDYPRLRRYSTSYPGPETLRKRARQGAVDPAPPQGFSSPTDGSQWIVDRAKQADGRPLYVLAWGSLTDVAQAVHDAPEIKQRLRIYSIGSWNTRHDPAARDYLFQHHHDLWWIEADTSFRGVYVGGSQHGDLGNRGFLSTYVRSHGALGDLLVAKKSDIKMGDTPSVLYLLRGRPDDPSSDHWGGAFVPVPGRPCHWTDNPDPDLQEGDYPGARTVNRWREHYLRDWQYRLQRLKAEPTGMVHSLGLGSE